MAGLKFVHAADLHLDSPFVGLAEADGEMRELLTGATLRAFENLIDLCLRERVDFLLVAGDIYDGADRSLRAQLAFRDGLARLDRAGIESFIVHGNHDPVDGWASSLRWPPGAHFFGAGAVEALPFAREGVVRAVVRGVSFAHRDVFDNLAAQFATQPPGALSIGLLHCNIGAQSGHAPYAPCALEDLAGKGVDYWALGHVHSGGLLREAAPLICYAGNPQGRHINEAGPRGCYLVEAAEDKRLQTKFVPLDAARWARAAVAIDGLASEEDLLGALRDELFAVQAAAGGRPSLCRLTLHGRGPLHATLRRPNYLAQLRETLRQFGRERDPLVWVEALALETRPAIDLAQRRQAQDLLGDCLRLVEEYRGDAAKRATLHNALKTLWEHKLGANLLERPDDAALLGLLDEAEMLCLDKLGEEAPL
ncbi:MAG: metallophosphoesterase family protein [Chloroflexota bacterium]